jgi:hypothetical protein
MKKNADSNFDLQERLYYLERAKEFLDKNEKIFSFLEKNRDIQNIGYWGINPLEGFKKALLFWSDKKGSETTKYYEIILQQTAKLVKPSLPHIDSDTVGQTVYGKQIFFTPSGLLTDPTVKYVFDKKFELTLTYLEACFVIENNLTNLVNPDYFKSNIKMVKNEEGIAGELIDTGLLDTLINLKSLIFQKDQDYFALIREIDKKYYWKKITLKPKLAFVFSEGCETIDILRLDVATTDNDSVILFAGIPGGTGNKPSGYTALPPPFDIEMKVPCTDCDTTNLYSSISDTAWEWKLPEADKNIKRLFAIGWHGHYEGRHLDIIELYVENAKGERIKLGVNSFCGNMWCNDASMESPYLTDANGDGLTDVVINASDNEKILFLQISSGGFEKRTIQPYVTHRSGGC